MVGWSPEFPTGEVRPLHYFGEDLVAYRDESGELHVLEAHCKHLGAHIGHGGKVVGDCVQCPFHGWRWGPDGTNRYIPYQPDRPNRALTLRVFPVREQYATAFDDLRIWRYQKYVEHPPLSRVDAKGYMALRKWATQFYDIPA
jgi:nitrite reductase/ring-hydroxylating ferredoxin subunit